MRPRAAVAVLLAATATAIVFAGAPRAGAGPAAATVTVHAGLLASQAPFMGLGVQFDPYDNAVLTPAQWAVVFQRVAFMHPGFLRVVEPASTYFGGYDANHNAIYRWTDPHVQQLLAILGWAKAQGIPVVLGDWGNPLIGGDPSIPAGFLQQLHDTYGFTNLAYYNVMNEPNNGSACPFSCWRQIVTTLSAEFATLGLNSWLKLVGPDNANEWDDTAAARAADLTTGLDTDNPIDGDSWITATLSSVPQLIGAYDSHRYASIYGLEQGIYGDQMRARRLQIDNLDSPAKPYFDGEVGLTARLVDPFRTAAFTDSQPYIADYRYGVWMGDMMVQGFDAGLSGASAWDLDDATHIGGGYGSQNLKQWGFWNSLGGLDGYPAADASPRPWYYAWSLLSRAFPAGSQLLDPPATGLPGVRVAAARIPQPGGGYDLSLAVVNDSDTPQTLTVALPELAGATTLARYDYFSGAEPTVPDATIPASPAAGVPVALPARGLVVLSSLGQGAPLKLDAGRMQLVDPLASLDHARALKLVHDNRAEFDGDASRAVPSGKRQGAITYHAGQMTGFRADVFFRGAAPAAAVEASIDGVTWWPVPLASTQPAPAVGGGGWELAELMPAAALPAGANQLRIVLGSRQTELSRVAIQAGRVGPACLDPALTLTPGSLAGAALGARGRTVRALLGAPTATGRRSARYCVSGGAVAGFVYGARGLELAGTNAGGARLGSAGPGALVKVVARHAGLRALGGGVYLAADGLVVLAHHGVVTGVAVAAPAVEAVHRALVRDLKLAGL